MPDRLDITTARELLDFAAGATSGVVSPAVAEEQLKGAVAIHNMLQDQHVAYLADEVGMGKTYVALGAMALLRHFHPSLRVLVLAPKQNIQSKWIKEWRNFVRSVVRVEDLRVKGLGGHPARALVKADSVADLVTEAANDPDRDFFARFTSFSLSMAASGESLDRRRDALLRTVPWLPRDLLDARREQYKRNFACAVNCALPDFDLLIVDEAHNLKAGWHEGTSSIRNTVLGYALGGRGDGEEIRSTFKRYRRKAKRVLFLSATPIEDDLRQLWNQLDLFGFGEPWKALCDKSRPFEEQREVVRRLLIRRSAELHSGGKSLTKTEYRREWRSGGITTHDEPLHLVSDRQRLAVALVQKKVSELLGSGEHNHSFQVGLLASFESFLETVKSTSARRETIGDDDSTEDDAAFHRTQEEIAAARDQRRDGIDIEAINAIARDHRRRFKSEMPHPKMDAIINELAASFEHGRKALVFVRRVASVDELQRKLEERYDQILFARLRRQLATDALREEIDQQITDYQDARAESRHRLRARDAGAATAAAGGEKTETSSVDSFFAWFFRGEGPAGVRSGASIAEQLDKVSGTYVTLLEDNYVASLLGVPVGEVLNRLAHTLGVSEAEAERLVGVEASRFLPPNLGRLQRRVHMRAFQAAALILLSEAGGEVGERAETVLRELFDPPRRSRSHERAIDGASEWLGTSTLFSELRTKPELRAAIWPTSSAAKFGDRLREEELRREFISTMIRKGHPIIDLFILIANRLGTLKQRSRESSEKDMPGLEADFLAELRRQQVEEPERFNSFHELSEAASKFHLIVQLNLPDLGQEALRRVPTMIGGTLRAQKPVAGMAGKVNGETVKQFRMPGYPLILITTDLLKEGEDLHTFCSSVYHYGIAWMPSELEQRVGRIDRVGSQTERRLMARGADVDGRDLLQVYYPHLSDTVEVLQLRRVYERLNRFLLTMHEGLGTPARERADVSVAVEGLRHVVDVAPIKQPLRSAFRVAGEMLKGEQRALAVTVERAEEMHRRFERIARLAEEMGATDVRRREGHQLVGEMPLSGRVQPFTLLLRSLHGRPILRCVSPVGHIGKNEWDDDTAARLAKAPYARLAVDWFERLNAYDVAVEGDVMLGASEHDATRARTLIESVIRTADRIERELFRKDTRLSELAADIDKEVSIER
jgi:hypothetical protein